MTLPSGITQTDYTTSAGINPNGSDNSPMDLSSPKDFKKQHDAIVKWAKENFQMMRNARILTERQWYLNLAFYFGKQNVAMLKPQTSGQGTSLSTRLYVPPAPYYRARPVINRIRSTIRIELAQLTGNKPNASIVPASAEDRDMYAAMAGEQIWENLYLEKRLRAVIRRTMWWTLTCGSGFLKCYWDFNKKDICYIHESPFHVLCPDLREEDIENQPFLIHAQAKSPDFIKINFPKAIDGSPINPASYELQDLLEDSFLNLIGSQSLNKQRSVLVLEIWVKPGAVPLFPEGAFFTICGDKIVQGQQGWPYNHGKYPFAKFDHIPGGKFYATSLIEDLIPLQKEYNRTRGQIVEAKNRMAKPQLLAPRGSIDASKITTEPGQVIQYTPGFDAPRPLPLEPLPQYVLGELDRILMDWKDIAGQHEVTHGTVPPGVTAATAISYLQEHDETRLSPTFDSIEEGIEKVAQMSLTYVQDYWDTEHMVKVTGTDGSFDVMTFKGSDLQNNVDIRIEAGSALPTSKAAKQAFIMDLMKMNFIDPQKGLEVMDMGGINKIYEQIQVDQRQSQRENLRMSKVTKDLLDQYQMQNQMIQEQDPAHFGMDPNTGLPMSPPLIIPVNTWDNHQLHIEYHNQFRKGQQFELLPEESKQLFESHVRQHIAAMGLETETMDPRNAAGLPPLPPEQQQQGSSTPPEPPGPSPMPQMQTGGI